MNFLITGANGAFGSEIKKALEKEGGHVTCVHFGVDWTYSDYSGLENKLRKADVLVLAHGSKRNDAMTANNISFRKIIELYLRLRKVEVNRSNQPQSGVEGEAPAALPMEGATRAPAINIWALGSEIEFHPAWGIKSLLPYLESKRAFARYAARLYFEPTLIYRHIVPSAFRSQMGFGLMSAKTAVRLSLFLIKRNWKYIPVTYTGFAFLNYFRFRKLGAGSASKVGCGSQPTR